MAQDSVLSLDSYDRRYFDTNDTIETVLTDAYFNKWKRELEVNEMVTVRIGQARHIIRITQINPFVKSSRSTDSYIDSRISAIETGTPVPDPDPAADPTWSLTLADNRLVPDISVFNYTAKAGAAYYIAVDDPSEPTNDAVIGESPPTNFTAGSIGTPDPVADWGVTESRTFWQYDDVDGIVRVDTADGSIAINVTSTDTIPPVWGDAAFSVPVAGDDPTTEIVITFDAAIDSASGLADEPYDLVLMQDENIIGTHRFDVSSLDTIGGFTPGVEVILAIRAKDKATTPNESISNSVSYTPVASTAAGTMAFPSASFEESEATATTITVNRTDGTAGDMYVLLTTVDADPPSAVEGTNYYGLLDYNGAGTITRVNATTANIGITGIGNRMTTGDYIRVESSGGTYGALYDAVSPVVVTDANNVTYTFTGADPGVGNDNDGDVVTIHTGCIFIADGGTTATRDILNINVGATQNNGYHVYIDHESNSIGNIGAIDSAIVRITGTGGVTAGFEQDLDLSGTNNIVVVETETIQPDGVASTDGNSNTWNVVRPDTRASADSYIKPTTVSNYLPNNEFNSTGDWTLSRVTLTNPSAGIGLITLTENNIGSIRQTVTVEANSSYTFRVRAKRGSHAFQLSVDSGAYTISGNRGIRNFADTVYEEQTLNVLTQAETTLFIAGYCVSSTIGNDCYVDYIRIDELETGGIEYGNATTIDLTGPYVSADIVFDQAGAGALGDHTVWLRNYVGPLVTDETAHLTMERPIATIGADGVGTVGGAGFALVTLTEAHNYTNGQTVYHDGNDIAAHNGSLVVSDVGATTYEIPVSGGPAAATVVGVSFGDTTLLGHWTDSTGTTDFWHWTKVNSSSVDREVNIPAVGTWTFRLYQQDPGVKVDKIVMALKSDSYDPNVVITGNGDAADDYFGEVESDFALGATVDGPNFPNTLVIPPPEARIDPTSFSPPAGATNIPIAGQIIFVSFANMTNLVATIKVYTGGLGGNLISGESRVISGIDVRFVLPALLSNGVEYTWIITGTVTDPDGVDKSINYNSSFTTITSILPADVIVAQDFSAYSTETGITTALMSDLFMADKVGIYGIEDGYPHNSNDIVASPDGDASRGYVQRISWAEDAWTFDGPTPPAPGSVGPPNGGLWQAGTLHPDSGTVWDEMFCSVEMYFSPQNQQGTAPRTSVVGMKTPLSMFGGSENYGADFTPDGTDGWQIRMMIAGIEGGPAFDWYPAEYLYCVGLRGATSGIAENYGGDLSLQPLVQMLPGRWWKATLYVKLNDFGVSNGKTRLWVGEVGRAQNLVRARDFMLFRLPGHNLFIRGSNSHNGYGGSSDFFSANEDHFNYFDNYRWQTSKPSDIPESDL